MSVVMDMLSKPVKADTENRRAIRSGIVHEMDWPVIKTAGAEERPLITHQYADPATKPSPEKVTTVPPVRGPLEGLMRTTLKNEKTTAKVESLSELRPLKVSLSAWAPEPEGETQVTTPGDTHVALAAVRSK